MLAIDVPGSGLLELEHLVLDYNGTLALDGELLPGVAGRLGELASVLTVHVVTADTHGTVAEKLRGLPCVLRVLPSGGQDLAKLDYVRSLGPGRTACLGNGRNDGPMLAAAALGVAVLGREGACAAVLPLADLVVTDVLDGLDLLLRPLRLAATLRT